MDTQEPSPTGSNLPTKGYPQGVLAALTYLVFFLPNLAGKTNDAFIGYHQRQAIGLALFGFVLQGIASVIGWWIGHVFFALWPLSRVLVWLVRFVLLYLVCRGGQSALKGETKELPWIGKYATRLFGR